jgi:VCBS repeat-containing protein
VSTATRGWGGGGQSNIYGAGDGSNADQGVGGDARANSGSGGGGGDYEGSGGLGGTGLVVIRYTPDQTAPTITGPSSATGASSAISIQENVTAVHTFTANETVSWTKSGTDNGFFSINSSGVLTITSRDFETKADANADNIYIVVITATDAGSNATSQTLSVTVTNVNEAPVIGAFSSAPTASYSVAENNSGLFNLIATDVDTGTTLTYSLTGTDAADFSIGSSGSLSLNPAADYENPLDSDRNNIYIVIAWVSDGSLSDSVTVTVTVTNANESSSFGTPSLSGALYKGVSATITVTTNAPGKLRFFVDGKRISTCLAVPTTGSNSSFSATCTFKPAVTGRHTYYATLIPSDITFTSGNSPTISANVMKRATGR